VISDDANQVDSSLLDELLANISTLASVYHKPPETFVSRVKAAPRVDDEEFTETGYSESPSQGVDGASPSSSAGTSSHVPVKQQAAASPAASAPMPDLLGDLTGMDNAIVPADEPAAPTRLVMFFYFLLIQILCYYTLCDITVTYLQPSSICLATFNNWPRAAN
jgi:AP-1 complex subunit beta-1